MSVAQGRAADVERGLRGDRATEVLAVILLAIATVGSAWCGFQASRWNGEESREARASAAARIEASREFSLAVQKIAYDATITAQYAQAVSEGREGLLEFYRENLVRKEFLPVLEQWAAQAEAGQAPAGNLFEQKAYTDALQAKSRAADVRVEASAARAEEAAATSDDYVLTTLIMASALFFAGVTTSFRTTGVRIVLLASSAIVIAIAAGRIADLPVT